MAATAPHRHSRQRTGGKYELIVGTKGFNTPLEFVEQKVSYKALAAKILAIEILWRLLDSRALLGEINS
jgi:hypothetical protein